MTSVPVVVSASPAPRLTVPPAADDGPPGRPEVSFVVVTYGTSHVVVEALASIGATTDQHSFEIVVVDNPHPQAGDRTFTELALFTRGVRIGRPTANLGFGGGCNLGATLARGEILVLLNPDAAVTDGWLQPLLDVVHDEHGGKAIAAPVLLDADGGVQECGQTLFADGTTWPRRSRPADSTAFEVDYASAACWVMRRADFVGLGGFDEAFHPAYFEDVDFVLRWRRAGGRCLVHPRSEVVHRQGHGTPDTPEPAHAQRQLLLDKWRSVLVGYPRPTAG